jgi:hypothetical protein
VTDFERRARAAIYAAFRDRACAPSAGELAETFGVPRDTMAAALHALADTHAIVLLPGKDDVWMAHPFSAVETDHVVTIGPRRWFANCAWDGLAILAVLGDGAFDTRSPATGEPLRFTSQGGVVSGDGVVHFLVPAREFWNDIGHT